MKKIIATIASKFDSTKPINELRICFPEGSEILSVNAGKDEPTLAINFSANKEIFGSDLWRDLEIVICKCDYTELELDDHKYIGTISFNDNLFAIFCKKGLIA